MTVQRIFMNYEEEAAAFATQLQTDLQEAGAEVVMDSVGSEDAAFEEFLSKELPECQHLILIQTPEALQSPRVRAVVDSALKQVQVGQMVGVLRVVAPVLNGVEVQALPLRWASTSEFDARQDYPRALARLCLHLGIGSNDASAAELPPAPPVPVLGASDAKETENKSPIATALRAQKSAAEDRPLRPHRYPHVRLRQRLFFLSLAMVLILVITAVTTLIYQNSTSARSTPTKTLATTSALTPTPRPKATHTPKPKAKATSVPASVPASVPTTGPASGPASGPPVDPNSPAGILTLATAGTPVLNDSLAAPSNNNWDQNGACIFTGGSYQANTPGPGAYYISCYEQAVSFSNFAYQVQMTILQGDGGGGMIFREGYGNNCIFFVNVDGTYALDINRNQPGVSGSSAAIKTGLNNVNILTIVARDNNVYLYVNGQFVNSFNDPVLNAGIFAVIANERANPVTVRYSNARVWVL